MARRRRSRSLSGSPEHHHNAAKKEAVEAVRFFDRSVRFAAQKQCDSALTAFAMGATREGATIVHQYESGSQLSVSESGKVVDAYEKAEKAVKKACFTGALSGLAGMRKRRK